MNTKYVLLEVEIHGVNIPPAYLPLLQKYIKEETVTLLTGDKADLFGFRNEYDDDVDVTIEEYINDPRFKCLGMAVSKNGGKAHWIPEDRVDVTIYEQAPEEN